MTERQQRTANSMREKMLKRYGNESSHKHNKNHLSFRLHSKSHPCKMSHRPEYNEEHPAPLGLNRELNLRKMRKRLDKGLIH